VCLGWRPDDGSNKTGHVAYHNIEVHLCKNYCRGKPISITYSECVVVALGIQHAMCMHHIVICDLPGSTTFSCIISWMAWFSKKVTAHKTCVMNLIFMDPCIVVWLSRNNQQGCILLVISTECIMNFSPTSVWNNSHSKMNSVRQIKNVYWSSLKYPLFWSDINETWSAGQIFEKYSNIKFTKICLAEAELFHYRQTWRGCIAFHSFANALKKRVMESITHA